MNTDAPKILNSVSALRDWVQTARAADERVALVPTMGALHEGHLSLCRIGQARADRVIVSIFVNPTQFAPTEDFSAYPRPFENDVALLRHLGVDAIYAPTAEEMYPAGFATSIHVSGVSEGLCGATRPDHFDGVATVVAKLLLQVQPDIAIFGEKDYQQLQVIKRLTRDLDLPVEIVPGPIARDADGLAKSSRNVYLTADERAIAPRLQRALKTAAFAVQSGANARDACAQARETLQGIGFGPIDYLELRDAETLEPLTRLTKPARLLAAAWLGAKTRLLDNVEVLPRN